MLKKDLFLMPFEVKLEKTFSELKFFRFSVTT